MQVQQGRGKQRLITVMRRPHVWLRSVQWPEPAYYWPTSVSLCMEADIYTAGSYCILAVKAVSPHFVMEGDGVGD